MLLVFVTDCGKSTTFSQGLPGQSGKRGRLMVWALNSGSRDVDSSPAWPGHWLRCVVELNTISKFLSPPMRIKKGLVS